MRPLPRLHAVTDHAVLTDRHYSAKLAAISAAGPAVALHARDRQATGRVLTETAARMMTLCAPPQAATFVNGRPDIAAALGTQGLQLSMADLSAMDARKVYHAGWIGVSVHSESEARKAADEGADFLLTGSIFPTGTHPGRPAAGLSLIAQVVALGLPVIAIGGITADRVEPVRQAGAYGVAAVSALWWAPDAGAAAHALLAPWMETDE